MKEKNSLGISDVCVGDLNPEEINKKRAEKGLEPLPQPTQDNVEKARREQRKKPHEEVPLPSPRPAKAEPQKKVA